jgi:hypothetical protein
MACQASYFCFVLSQTPFQQAAKQTQPFTAEHPRGILGALRRQRMVFAATMNDRSFFIGCLLRSPNFPAFLGVTLSGRGDKDINTVASALGVTL